MEFQIIDNWKKFDEVKSTCNPNLLRQNQLEKVATHEGKLYVCSCWFRHVGKLNSDFDNMNFNGEGYNSANVLDVFRVKKVRDILTHEVFEYELDTRNEIVGKEIPCYSDYTLYKIEREEHWYRKEYGKQLKIE